jgi:prophage tail gpP-like protein
VCGAKGEIYLDGQKAATVRVDSRTSHGSPTSFRLELSFRGLSSAVVNSFADHPWTREQKEPSDICKTLMGGYEPQFKDESGDDRELERFIIAEGETVERATQRATCEFGFLLQENEDGAGDRGVRAHIGESAP